MDNKGELQFGPIIMIFVGVIVALVLFQAAAQNVGTVTNTETYVNQSVSIPAALNTAVALNGQSATSVVVLNSTSNATINSANYTVTNYVVNNGQLEAQLKWVVSGYNGSTVKVSYVSEPDTYARDSSTRTIVGLIVILSALALAGWVIAKVYEDGVDAFK